MTSDHPTSAEGELYDANYYASNLGIAYERNDHWLRFFGDIAERIVAELEPRSVLDVGCAFGFLVESLRDRDVDAKGIDISSYAISQVAGSAVGHCTVASATEAFDGRYDLVVSIEMVEHMSSANGRQALANMTAVTDQILLSTTPFDHTEASHLNVRPAEYWAGIMHSLGFHHDLTYDASYLTEWAALYVRTQPSARDLVIQYERADSNLRIERNQLRKEVLRLDSLLGGLRTELASAIDPEVVAELRADLARLVAEGERLEEDKADLEQALANANDEAATFRQEAYETQHRLNQLVNSRSWRLMGRLLTPVRLVRRLKG